MVASEKKSGNKGAGLERQEGTLKRTRTAMVFLSILPIGYCVFFMSRYRYDTPYWDQWGHQLPLILKSFDGTLRVTDLWNSVEEHRLFFPNIIFVGLARLTHWNLNCELMLLMCFAIANFVLVSKVILHSEREIDRKGTLWALPALALLFFSFSQHAIWMWGLHLMVTFTSLCMLTVIFMLSRKEITTKQVLCAVGLAIIASYSFGAGLTIWPAGLVLLLLHVAREPTRNRRYVVCWALTAVFVLLGYLVGYRATPTNDSALEALGAPVGFVAYCFTCLGGPIAFYSPLFALAIGLSGALLFLFLLYRIVVIEKLGMHVVSPYMGLATCAICAVVLISLKHHTEGFQLAMSSRSLIWSTLFWVGTIGLLYVLSLVSTNKRVRISCYTVSALLCVFTLASSLYGTYRADERHDVFLLGRQALISGENSENLKYLYPDAGVPEGMRDTLAEYKLTVFRE